MSLKYEIIRFSYCITYYRHGDDHRVGGPSELHESGDKFWDQYGLPHRLDGPAIDIINYRYHEYYIRGTRYTKKEYESKIPNRYHV